MAAVRRASTGFHSRIYPPVVTCAQSSTSCACGCCLFGVVLLSPEVFFSLLDCSQSELNLFLFPFWKEANQSSFDPASASATARVPYSVLCRPNLWKRCLCTLSCFFPAILPWSLLISMLLHWVVDSQSSPRSARTIWPGWFLSHSYTFSILGLQNSPHLLPSPAAHLQFVLHVLC